MPRTRWIAAQVVSFILYYSGGLWAFERMNRERAPGHRCLVVNYHRVASESPGYRDIAVDPASFRSHLEYMLGRGYRFLSLTDYQAYLAGEFTLVGDSILLTLDDGYRDNYTAAFPILQDLGVPAAVFLCTGSIETTTLLWWDRVARVVRSTRREGVRAVHANTSAPEQVWLMLERSLKGSDERASATISKMVDWLKAQPADERERIIEAMERSAPQSAEEPLMLSWDMVREMYGKGISFGAHTVTHPVLSELTPEAAQSEILESKRCIEEHLGTEVAAFAYPYGKRGYFNSSTVDALRLAGLTWAYTTENGLNTPQSDPYTLRRNGLRDIPRYFLAARLAGVFEHPALARLRSRIEGSRSMQEDR